METARRYQAGLAWHDPRDGGRPRSWGRPRLMGILNVTPDSFSDGGLYRDVSVAVEHAAQMVTEGAEIIDVGGESTRPGAGRVAEREQVRRVVPVIERLRARLDQARSRVVISVDTTLSGVAKAAMEAGAGMINDVSAGRDDPAVLAVAARWSAPLVLMHMRGTPRTMQDQPRYHDVVEEVRSFLMQRAQAAMRAGVRREHMILDPGIGFGKTVAHNVALLAHLDRLVASGYPVMLGTSRKSFLAGLCAARRSKHRAGNQAEPAPGGVDWVGATCATTAAGVLKGVSLFRVHDVSANRQAADVAWSLRAVASAGRGSGGGEDTTGGGCTCRGRL